MQPVDEPYAKVEVIEKISLIKRLRLLVIDMRTASGDPHGEHER